MWKEKFTCPHSNESKVINRARKDGNTFRPVRGLIGPCRKNKRCLPQSFIQNQPENRFGGRFFMHSTEFFHSSQKVRLLGAVGEIPSLTTTMGGQFSRLNGTSREHVRPIIERWPGQRNGRKRSRLEINGGKIFNHMLDAIKSRPSKNGADQSKELNVSRSSFDRK